MNKLYKLLHSDQAFPNRCFEDVEMQTHVTDSITYFFEREFIFYLLGFLDDGSIIWNQLTDSMPKLILTQFLGDEQGQSRYQTGQVRQTIRQI